MVMDPLPMEMGPTVRYFVGGNFLVFTEVKRYHFKEEYLLALSDTHIYTHPYVHAYTHSIDLKICIASFHLWL